MFWASFLCTFRSPFYSSLPSPMLTNKDGIIWSFFLLAFRWVLSRTIRGGSHAEDKRERVISAYLFSWLPSSIVTLCWLCIPPKLSASNPVHPVLFLILWLPSFPLPFKSKNDIGLYCYKPTSLLWNSPLVFFIYCL